MFTQEYVNEIIGKLSSHEKAFVLACSEHPKKWMTIRRHAKIPTTVGIRMRRWDALIINTPRTRHYLTELTPLGLAVKAQLKEKAHG